LVPEFLRAVDEDGAVVGVSAMLLVQASDRPGRARPTSGLANRPARKGREVQGVAA